MGEISHKQWFENFKIGVGILLDEEKSKGNIIKSIQLSRSLHEKICEYSGENIKDMYGYVVEVFDSGYDEDEILITGHICN